MIRVAVEVSGRVQGVFFRASAKEVASRLGLHGWARNNRDGSVSIEAEGNEVAVEEFIEWCHRGPEHARVESVQVSRLKPVHYTSFEIRRS